MKRTTTTDRDTIESIIHRALVCRVAMSDGDRPYVVPVCFGYEDGVLYFHSSLTGTKVDILRRNDAVCVEFDVDEEITTAKSVCSWGLRYRSVIGFGQAFFIEDEEKKRQALDIIVAHYGGDPQEYPQATLRETAVVRIEIQSATAKVSGY
jgi:nitroimidazol reductase NimA-like FMN-containing flavoprotein (pyridoxamine 5'-phosphate oxidase superfamily)